MVRYCVGDLDPDPDQQNDGLLSVLHSAPWFVGTVGADGFHVTEPDCGSGGFITVTRHRFRQRLARLSGALLKFSALGASGLGIEVTATPRSEPARVTQVP